jgi:hypothetical protein
LKLYSGEDIEFRQVLMMQPDVACTFASRVPLDDCVGMDGSSILLLQVDRKAGDVAKIADQDQTALEAVIKPNTGEFRPRRPKRRQETTHRLLAGFGVWAQ